MGLLSQIICALLVLAVLLNDCECRPDPVLCAVGGLAGGTLGAVVGGLPLVGGLLGGR